MIATASLNCLRNIEDCHTLNQSLNKALIDAGWLEMDAYMPENKPEGERADATKPGTAHAEALTEAPSPKTKIHITDI